MANYSIPGLDDNNPLQQKVKTGAPGGAAETGPGSGIPTPPAQGGGAGPQPQGQGTGFVNLQAMMDANKSSGQEMAKRLADQGNYLGNNYQTNMANAQAKWGADAYGNDRGAYQHGTNDLSMDSNVNFSGLMNDATNAQNYTKALGSYGGLQGLLGGIYGSANAMDAGLAGYYGNKQFEGLNDKFGNLTNDLITADQNAHNTSMPTPQHGPALRPNYGPGSSGWSNTGGGSAVPGNVKNWPNDIRKHFGFDMTNNGMG